MDTYSLLLIFAVLPRVWSTADTGVCYDGIKNLNVLSSSLARGFMNGNTRDVPSASVICPPDSRSIIMKCIKELDSFQVNGFPWAYKRNGFPHYEPSRFDARDPLDPIMLSTLYVRFLMTTKPA